MAGIGGKDKKAEPLMSSLPSELTFNDLRDCSRRHQKKERTIPANLHSAAARSIMRKPGGCLPLDLEDSDWATPIASSFGGLRSSVCSAVRTTDMSLGVNCSGLTKHKTNKNYTKPHILAGRFQLFQLMSNVWHSCAGDHEKKNDAVREAVKTLWLCRLVCPHLFVQVADSELVENENHRYLVLLSGPNCLKVLQLKKIADDSDCFGVASTSYASGCKYVLLPSLESVQVGLEELTSQLLGKLLLQIYFYVTTCCKVALV